MPVASNQQYYNQVFKNQELVGEQLQSTEFEECTFTDCNFSETTFKNCRFISCEFNGCNLSLLRLTNSRLTDIHFQQCKLVGVDWTLADWPSYHLDFELNFKQCVLNDNSLFGLTLHSLNLVDCKAHDMDFREGDFSHLTITYCDLTHAQFMRTNLQQSDFTESRNYAINPFENNLKGAKFSRWEAFSLLESMGIELVD
ncbi:pentapeptide repeat-containing protein [Vibrio gallicus]|uniref:pentapeptide repeat-containing protein n=1 Tax=Vibrio gallicus TaxID=190897 RepID=UPI0021C4712A|nr:pentapeptide repeat-containing protein [Vibrio gallicus]